MNMLSMQSDERPAALAPHPALEPYYEAQDAKQRFVRTIFDDAALA